MISKKKYSVPGANAWGQKDTKQVKVNGHLFKDWVGREG